MAARSPHDTNLALCAGSNGHPVSVSAHKLVRTVTSPPACTMHLPLLTEKTMNESIKAALIALAAALATAAVEKVLSDR